MTVLRRASAWAAMWAALVGSSAAEIEMKIEAQARMQAQLLAAGGLFIDGAALAAQAGEAAKKKADPAGPHLLEFTSGERLHGALEGLDFERAQLTWRRSDASGPLAFPLAQVSRLRFGSRTANDGPAMATIMFTGGDWLLAQVTAIQGDKIHLRLPDGARLTADRGRAEWIYFSKQGTAECYAGPASFAGWDSAGGWSYRDGALRATSPAAIGRMFHSLPDQVEYRMTVDQGALPDGFMLSLHGSSTTTRALRRGVVQLSLRDNALRLWACIDGTLKSVETDLTPLLGEAAERAARPMHMRVFEDFSGGRLLVYLNDRRAAEWVIDKGPPGKNGGALQFQPMRWSGEKEQSLSNIQVLPWDGREPSDEARETERAVLSNGRVKTGRMASLGERTFKLDASSVPREELTMLQFRRPARPLSNAASIAQVRLAHGGEFDAIGLGWLDGKVVVRTNFGGEIALEPATLSELGFRREPAKTASGDDLLVFRNGDRLRGTLAPTNTAGGLSWRSDEAAPPVEFTPDQISSLLFAPRPAGTAGGMIAHFRNGDWIRGTFVTINGEQLVLNTEEAGQLSIPRALVKALYFASDGSPAVSDGGSDHEIWKRGLSSGQRQKKSDLSSPWLYAAGSYTPLPARLDANRNPEASLGRAFETLAARVEVSFTVTTAQSPVFFTAQLFTDQGNPRDLFGRLFNKSGNRGYMIHLSTVGLSIYDMNPRAAGRGIHQQQFPFGPRIDRNARQRRIQVLADRSTGRMTILVDGIVTARVAPKPSDSPRTLGRGVIFAPQSSAACTFSDLWIGPWNGRIPGPETEDAPPVIVLANEDEVEGGVELGTPTKMRIASEVGPLELPVERLALVDFGGSPVARQPGTRLHLAGQGALTVGAWRIENGNVICRSAVAGELTLPLTSVQEIVLAPPPSAAAD